MDLIQNISKSKKVQNLKNSMMLKLFGLTKVPLIFWVNPSVCELTAERCEVKIPLSRTTKNHWGTMYFGALAIGADCAAGLFAMYKAEQFKGSKFSIVFKDFKASFLKRPDNDVIFSCNDFKKIEMMLQKAHTSGERVTEQVKIEARVPANSNELVAEFELGLSLKLSKK